MVDIAVKALDVVITAHLGQPKVLGDTVASPRGVDIETVLGEPFVSQDYKVLAEDTNIAIELGQPTVSDGATCYAEDLSLEIELDTPTVTQNYVLVARNIWLDTVLGQPTAVGADFHAEATDLDITITLEKPTVTQNYVLTALGINIPTVVQRPRVKDLYILSPPLVLAIDMTAVDPSSSRYTAMPDAGMTRMWHVSDGPPRIRRDKAIVFPRMQIQWNVAENDKITLMNSYTNYRFDTWEINLLAYNGWDTYDCILIPGTFRILDIRGEMTTIEAEVEIQGVTAK